jgi:hypothetical protein
LLTSSTSTARGSIPRTEATCAFERGTDGHGQAGLRLEKGVLDALRHETALHHVGGPGQSRAHVAARVGAYVHQVATLVHGGRPVTEGLDRVHHGFEHLVANRCLQRFRGQPGVEAGVGQDEGQDVAHAPGSLALGHEHRPVPADQPYEAIPGNVPGRQDPIDPGHPDYDGGVDLEDDGSRVPAQHHRAVKHVVDRHVGYVRLVSQRLLVSTVSQAVPADPISVGRGRPPESPRSPEDVRPPRIPALGQGLVLPRVGGGENGVHDPLVAGAPADVTVERSSDLLLVHVRGPVEQRRYPGGDSGGAVAALKSPLANEGLRQDSALAFRHSLEGSD